jgi:hypothetical protein
VAVGKPSIVWELEVVRESAHRVSQSFEPKDVSGQLADWIVDAVTEIERVFASVKLRAAGRVEETGYYEGQGHKTAATWYAGKTGEPVGRAISNLKTLKGAERHPVLDNALRNGGISIERAEQIANAADQCPEEAENLVNASSEQNHDEFKKTCERVQFSSRSTEEEVDRHERMRKSRQCRMWTDQEGFGRIDAKLATDAFAVLKANLERIEREVFDKARKDGAHESRQAYMADALVEMAKASGSEAGLQNSDGTTTKSSTTKTLVRIRVDLDALMRGYAEAGEICEIPGVGRVSVAIARAVLGDALLELVITNGIDVSTVVSDTRYIKRALEIALQERDPTCVVPGCNATDFLQRDHWRKDFAKKGKTEIDNLCRICTFHHRQKTHGGWVLSGGPGNWSFEEVYVRTPGSSESEEDPPDQTTDPPGPEPPGGSTDPPEPTQLF